MASYKRRNYGRVLHVFWRRKVRELSDKEIMLDIHTGFIVDGNEVIGNIYENPELIDE